MVGTATDKQLEVLKLIYSWREKHRIFADHIFFFERSFIIYL